MKFFCTLNILNCATCKTIFFSLRSLKSKKRAWQATFKHPRREILLCEGKNFKLYNHEETDSPFSFKEYQIKDLVLFFSLSFLFFYLKDLQIVTRKIIFSEIFYFIRRSRSERRRRLRLRWNRKKHVSSLHERISYISREKFSYRKIIKHFFLNNIIIGKLS